MDGEYRKLLQCNRRGLIDNISDPLAVCDYLFEKEVLTEEMKQEVEAKVTPIMQIRKILDILATRGVTAFTIFHECLLATDNTIAADLLKLDIQNSHPNFGLFKENVAVVKEGSLKRYSDTLLGGGGWEVVYVKLNADSTLMIQTRQGVKTWISLKDVWNTLSYGHILTHSAEDIPSLPPENSVMCLLVVLEKPSVKAKLHYLLFDSEHELDVWMKAIIRNVPQLLLQTDLISQYRKKCSKIQVSPLFDEEGYSSDLLEFYVSPKLSRVELLNDKPQQISVQSYHNIFVKNSKICQHIYISSPAGCGKTCFVNHMALLWCQARQPMEVDNKRFHTEDINEMKQFTFLFLIYLRDLHNCECDIDIMIQKQLLSNLANPHIYANLENLRQLLCDEKCLVIMDGLDEWCHSDRTCPCARTNKQIPHCRARPLCTVLTTARPWKMDVAALKADEIDQKLDLGELDDNLLEMLIENALKQMNKLYGKAKSTQDFKKAIEAKKLSALSKIPLVLMQLLTLWYDDEPIGQSQCEIYIHMIEFLYKLYYKKKGLAVEINERQAPMCFQDNWHCLAHMDVLLKLGRLAFYTLFSDNQESSLVFDMTIAYKYMNDKNAFEMSREVGILTQQKVIGKLSKRQSNVWFLHKTFQEFLAALYMSQNSEQTTDIESKIMRFCCSVEKIFEMSQIVMFISGLCPHLMSHLCEHIRQTVSADVMTKKYRSTCQLGPGWSREGQRMKQIQAMMMDWLEESWLNGHNSVNLPLLDVFIDGGSAHFGCPWSEMLKSLVVNNPILTLYIWQEERSEILEDVKSSITHFRSIEKLWLAHVPDIYVIQLLSHSSDVKLNALMNLEWLTLQMNISSNIVCSLVDYILELPKSVKVRLDFCHITDQGPGSRDWKAYIMSHPQLTVDYDDIDDFGDMLFRFHTNK